MAIPFCKFQGFGNDYIVILRDDVGASVPLGELAIAMCRRNTGVGADGIAALEKRDGIEVDFFCEIVNPDGSTAGFSGNGTRCAVAYLHYKKRWTEQRLRLETRSGVKVYDLIERNGEGEFLFEAQIGKPKFASEEVPVLTDTRRDAVVNEPIEVDGKHFVVSAVNVGNPVACIFVDNFNFDWRNVGRLMETHERFPERANIVFVKIEDAENLDIRIWERGAGETAASGTCSSGAAILSSFLLKTGRAVSVRSEGGTTDILWRDDDEIVIKGSAKLAFCGEFPV
jgi:diaminopimelate epimerase